MNHRSPEGSTDVRHPPFAPRTQRSLSCLLVVVSVGDGPAAERHAADDGGNRRRERSSQSTTPELASSNADGSLPNGQSSNRDAQSKQLGTLAQFARQRQTAAGACANPHDAARLPTPRPIAVAHSNRLPRTTQQPRRPDSSTVRRPPSRKPAAVVPATVRPRAIALRPRCTPHIARRASRAPCRQRTCAPARTRRATSWQR